MGALDELKSLNSRHNQVDTEAALAALRRSAVEDGEEITLDEEDEAAVRQMLLQQQNTLVRRYSHASSMHTQITAFFSSLGFSCYASSSSQQQRMCRLDDSPPRVAVAEEASMISKPEPPKPAEKILFGVRAKPLKVVHTKKIVKAPKDLTKEPTTQSNGKAVAAAGTGTNGAAEAANGDGLLGLGSYGSDESE